MDVVPKEIFQLGFLVVRELTNIRKTALDG
jgi:hypothetical protein